LALTREAAATYWISRILTLDTPAWLQSLPLVVTMTIKLNSSGATIISKPARLVKYHEYTPMHLWGPLHDAGNS